MRDLCAAALTDLVQYGIPEGVGSVKGEIRAGGLSVLSPGRVSPQLRVLWWVRFVAPGSSTI